MRSYITALLFLSIATNMPASSVVQEVLLNMDNISAVSGDITEIYFAPGTSTMFRNLEDSKKNFDTTMPQIYSLTSDLIPCFSNGYGNFTQSTVVTIGIWIPSPGAYRFYASSISNFDPGSVILLEDRALGKFIDLRQQSDTIEIDQVGQNQERFYLHVSYPPVLNVSAAGCNNDSGSIVINEDNTIQWSSVLLFDSTGHLAQSYSDTTANLNFENLSAGNYQVAFIYSSGYTFVKSANLTSHQIGLNLSSSVTEALIGQTIQFFSDATNTSQYLWDFGDSSFITGVENPEYSYYKAGTYSVTLHATNDFSCSAFAHLSIQVLAQAATAISNTAEDNIRIFADHKNVVIKANDLEGEGYVYGIYNLDGQLLLTNPIVSSYSLVNLERETAGIYLVQIQTPNGSFAKEIYLGDARK